MTKHSSLRLWLAVLLLLASIGLILYATWPVERERQVLPMPTIEAPQSTPLGLSETGEWQC